jgi:HlyD family secretion protein
MVIMAVYWLLTPAAVLVETARITEQKFTAYVEEDGRTRVRDRYVVSAPLAGRVPRTSLRPGDVVSAGQTLAQLAPNPSPLIEPRTRLALEERVGSAEAALEEAVALQERAQVMLAKARTDLDRTAELKARGVAAVAQLDRDTFAFRSAERDALAAERRRHVADHVLAEARAALKRSSETEAGERFAITAPVNGRVLKVMQESEGVVGLGAPLLEIGDVSDLEVIVDVLTSDAAQIRQSANVLLERSGIATTLEGRVKRVEPSGFTKVSALGVEEQRVWVVIDIISPQSHWNGLADGFRVSARIVAAEIEKALVAPVGALFRRADTWQLFVVEGGRARLRTVEVSRRSGRGAAIAKGLRPGDTVVVYPPSTLTPDARVRVR